MRAHKSKMLLQAQIEHALKLTKSNRQAARFLRVSYNFYKKWAKLYKNAEGVTLFDAHINRAGVGIKKTQLPRYQGTKIPLDDILMGKCPQYPRWKLYNKIVANQVLPEKCNICGYCERRPTDQRPPLVLHHMNGDKTDHRITNIELLCYNCYFVYVGVLTVKDLRKDADYGTAIEQPRLMSQSEIDDEKAKWLEDKNTQGTFQTDLELDEDEKMSILKDIKNIFDE